jgi:hypothetical protein
VNVPALLKMETGPNAGSFFTRCNNQEPGKDFLQQRTDNLVLNDKDGRASFTLEEVAEILDIDVSTVKYWHYLSILHDGHAPGGVPCFAREHILTFLNGRAAAENHNEE